MYEILVSFGEVYISQTGQCINNWLKEHLYHVNSMSVNRSVRNGKQAKCERRNTQDCDCGILFLVVHGIVLQSQNLETHHRNPRNLLKTTEVNILIEIAYMSRAFDAVFSHHRRNLVFLRLRFN